MKQFQLCCMSFDGETQIERPVFNNEEDAWEYNSDIGSKWYFYPFRFLITTSHKTIIGTCDCIPFALGKRLKTVKRIFEKCSKDPEMEAVEWEKFASEVNYWIS
jgi:hypothetical protein